MPLFQKSVITKHLQSQDKSKLLLQWSIFKNHFHNLFIQENIRSSKEEQYQGEFLIDLFVNGLGYVKNPTPNFNLTTEYKNVKDSKKADGAILVDGKVKAVIELKGTNTTDLGKIEVQAFGYKNNQPDCAYVVTSNFEKLRFYIDNATEFLEFNLFQLTEKEFELLYLCLAYENIANDVPKKLKEQSLSKEKDITKALYTDYSLFKRELHQDLVKQNSAFDALELFKKSQKLLDRFLFLFFAEDRQLLPPNSVRLILNDWRDLQERDENVPLYNRFKKYFEYLNTGFKGKRYDVFAYNGGLFKPDEVLDVIKIDDELLYKHTLKLSEYDFASEVDVNILGHIFENSLNELDEIKAQLEGTVAEKATTKRKKDGVFYTPKYITKYIVDNTIGKLCTDKKTEFNLIEEDYTNDKKRTKATKQPLLEKLNNYRNWLLQITICDPACGSGAFLNQALDFLITEHKYIDELQAKLFGDALVLSDIEKSILENNLFGVDLNEESVEIAKLSLWLRTAQPNRKLNDLNNNIKCGNSLIDDVAIAGDKAFNWQTAFPKIFENDGFDVIIGNPPYVRQELLGNIQKKYFSENYPNVFNGTADLYVYFYSLSLTILKPKGILGFITPNKWMERKYGFELRNYLKSFYILQIINYGELKIFEDASTEPEITIIENTINNQDIKYSIIKSLIDAQNYDYKLQSYKKENLEDAIWRFTDNEVNNILRKFNSSNYTLNEYTNGGNYRGILTGLNEAFIIDENTRNKIVSNDNKSISILKKMVEGDDLRKWSLLYSGRYLVATEYSLDVPNEYPAVFDYLKSFEEKLIKRQDKGLNYWNLRSCDYYNELEKPKLIYYHTAVNHNFYYDTEKYYISANCYFIANADRYLQCVLNSKLFNCVKKYLFPAFGDSENGGRVRLDANKMVKLPIKIISEEIKSKFTKKAEEITLFSNQLQEQSQKFQRTLQRKFAFEVLSKKLQYWYLLSYADFIKELTKQKVKLSISQEADWEDYFNTEAKKVLALKSEIDATDKEIDAMVYKLYDLTADEIKIVEQS
ncbi:Eco57I restriction-modification methylase domain-containing protein [Pedobacter jamesrossensis]|uniref:site-specific DNA-methyltransferase (adenine-specific) n=1 Tax=Pedobacter jamesrossensis TaxID=1908238 RepID=A0ABV8NIS1_9SPHI